MSSQDYKNLSIPLGSRWGEWKHELKDANRILSFTSCGNHISNLSYEEASTGFIKNSMRLSGFSIQNVINQNTKIEDGIDCLLQNALQGKQLDFQVPQTLSFKDPTTGQLYVKSVNYFLRFNMFKQRVCHRNSYETLPFGYTLKMASKLRMDFEN